MPRSHHLNPGLLLLLLLLSASTRAQTLARPGWRGSGLNAEPWWKTAVFARMAAGDNAVTRLKLQLPLVHSLGVDALCLDAPQLLSTTPPPLVLEDLGDAIAQGGRANVRLLLTLPVETPAALEVARFWLARGIAGFQLTTAGPALISSPTPVTSPTLLLNQLRALASGFVGQRVLILPPGITDSIPAPGPSPRRRYSAHRRHRRRHLNRRTRSGTPIDLQGVLVQAVLPLTAPFDAEALHSALATLAARGSPAPIIVSSSNIAAREVNVTSTTDPTPAIETPPRPVLAADATRAGLLTARNRLTTALLLLTRGATLLPDSAVLSIDPVVSGSDGRQELPAASPPAAETTGSPESSPPVASPGGDSNAALSPEQIWLRRLTALHHASPAVNRGALIPLHVGVPDVVVFVRRPATVSSPSPAVVVLINLSSGPQHLQLSSELHRLGLRGNFLRPLLRSDELTGPLSTTGLTLPGLSAYAAELRP